MENGKELSIVERIQKFNKAVNNMDSVVMVPCQLLDESTKCLNSGSYRKFSTTESDMHRCFTLLKKAKYYLNQGDALGANKDNSVDEELKDFVNHLEGLYKSLDVLTEVASGVAKHYQNEVVKY
ncbi:hypothetical protein TrispH2_000989 [Trichoplax sp. H2]|uniref:Uncharacterized protein n=1 Tax=Trichoplax adhaerens TaxID=10228 RepID=B3RM33_TRIAD|nr:hypothetical protein TRIADDRAFT_52216 [Trichoplax adhaerens]EDV28892.1 hypothetical protein TRIADDRAFT_52216 [Trichoplax adhaerens]RDD46692.1 hypothetical protein TrispH2_000989 [Trichoplax sp. H2]|eukprot:XP_002108094.1 hypothetical protein TRIADDRAFT_52216 [Trichoplax adhaerens]